jgi:Peptidase inhibitor family I36
MNTKTTRLGVVAAGLAAALAVGASGAQAKTGLSPAQATKLQRQVDNVVRHSAPGARQVSPNTVVWAHDGVTLRLPVPGKASAAALGDCRIQRACLWQDANYRGRRAAFYAYGTYQLARYGLTPATHFGASSFYNHQTGGAKALLYIPNRDFTFNMRGHGNLVGFLNDSGKTITLTP